MPDRNELWSFLRDYHKTPGPAAHDPVSPNVRQLVSLILVHFIMDARSACYVLRMLFIYFFLWPPYAPAQVNGGMRNFYTWWTLSVNREVTTWIFSY